MPRADGQPLAQIGRLALRHEGDWWNAYYAMPGTMERAILLGSVRFTAVIENPAVKQGFMDLMRELVGRMIEKQTGQRPIWPGARPAPEHERSGNG